MKLSPDLYCFYSFKPTTKPQKSGHLGEFEFLYLQQSDGGAVLPVCGCSSLVVVNEGAGVFLDWESGNPPSPKAGRALDLQRAAWARVKTIAAATKAARFYWVNDQSKVQEGSEGEFVARLIDLCTLSDDFAAPSFASDLRALVLPDLIPAPAPSAAPAP